MKRLFFLVVTLTGMVLSITSCSSSEEVVYQSNPGLQDTALTTLYSEIDSIHNEYSTLNPTRVDWDKWGRRALNCVIDGFVGFAFFETGPGALVGGAIASGLYEDYLDYMVTKNDQVNPRVRIIPRSELSAKTAVFTVDNAAFIDSIGHYHNLILNDVIANGKSYTNDQDGINYVDYHKDVIAAIGKFGITEDNPILPPQFFEYLESIIKPIASVDLYSIEEVNTETLHSILFNERFHELIPDKLTELQHRNICEKLIYNCITIEDDKLVEYGTKINELIENSDVDDNLKNKLKIANNIAINSSLRQTK